MKILIMAALVAATPALAQTTPAPADSAPTTTPAPADPVGGYQPSHPAISGPVTAGTPVVFQAAPPPDQAYPAPPPLDHYPPCKKGQYDKCLQRHSPK